MTKRFLRITVATAALIAGLAGAARAQTSSSPADVSQRIGQLQEQIDQLQNELATLKKQVNPPATSSATSAPAATSSPPGAPAQTAETTSPSAAPASPAVTPAAPTWASLMGSTTVTGFIDGYYDYNFNHPRTDYSASAQSPVTPLRAFDGPANQFAFNMAELTIARAPDASNSRLGYDLTFGAGNAMNVVNGTDPGGLGFAQYVKEAYLSYLAPMGKGLEVDFGKFVTPAGAEVIETKDDWNYSRSLLFFYAIPFYHFGLRARYVFNDKYSLTGYVVNGWNDIIDNNTGKTYGASFGWNPTKKVSVTQTYLAGPEMNGTTAHARQLSDTVVQYAPTGKLSLMVNYDYGRGDVPQGFTQPVWWSGVAGYLRYAFNEDYALATRYEYYDDPNGFTTGTAQHLNEFTGTFERKVAGHLITRLEYRRDMSNRLALLKGSTPTDAQNTLAAGLVYLFDLKEAK